ncbi:MAG: hypothetical protein ACU0DK_13965, partial [Pseudooceanicola sp.]
GRLVVSEEISEVAPRTGSLRGVTKYRDRVIGSIRGHAVVKYDFTHHRKLPPQIEIVNALNFGSEKEECRRRLSKMNIQNVRIAAKKIQRAERVLSDCSKLNNDFEAFFETENIRRINEWAAHKNAPLFFLFRVTPNGRWVKVSGDSQKMEALELPPLG